MQHLDDRGVVALSIPAKAEYIVLCRLALAGLAVKITAITEARRDVARRDAQSRRRLGHY